MSDVGEGMEKIVEQSLLYDFYGELLTPHQRSVYEDAVFNDMSLSEVADNYGISRQGVHDLLKRCDKSMQDYENKLHLISKFTSVKDKVGKIHLMTASMEGAHLQKEIDVINSLAAEILEEL